MKNIAIFLENYYNKRGYLSASVIRLPRKEALYQVSFTFTTLRFVTDHGLPLARAGS